MREGTVFKTAASNPENFRVVFEDILKKEQDILYIGFSSGLSNTFNAGMIAANELKEEYPNRKIIAIDSLCASAGQTLLVYFAVQKRDAGATLEDTASESEKMVPNLCHWFTVDNLVYLKRGGRVSPTTAFVGNVLNIKPVLHVDEEGKLVNTSKVRGRKQAIRALADKYAELVLEQGDGIYFISHGDCLEEAKQVESRIFELCGKKAALITEIGPVIGSHAGPGTIALFFVGAKR